MALRTSGFGFLRTGILAPAFAVSVALLMVSVSGAAQASAAPPSSAPAPSAASSEWAYGALKHVDLLGYFNGPAGANYTFRLHATFGFAGIFNETQIAPGVYELNATRVMGSVLNITICRPDCLAPTATGTIYHHAWESLTASSILYTNGSVQLNGSSVPALALASSHLHLSAGLVESTSYVAFGVVQVVKQLSANLTASDTLTLAPPLGLVPLNVTPGTSWTSSATFHQAGAYSWSLNESRLGALVNLSPTYTNSGGGSFQSNGTVNLYGAAPGTTVDLAGSTYQAVNFTLAGPFLLREGWILLPTRADVFGDGNQSWLPNQSSFANSSQANVEVGANLLGAAHLSFGGSGQWWRSRSSSPSVLSSVSAIGPAVSTVAGGPAGTNATYVQGAPESPAQATADQYCLSTGLGCTTAPAGLRAFLSALLVAAAVVTVAALVAVLTVNRRRQLPPPVFPNASLYPPGAASARNVPAARPPTNPPSPPPSSPEEDDPLGHLW